MKKKILVILALCCVCNALPAWACSAATTNVHLRYGFLGWDDGASENEVPHDAILPSQDNRPYALGADQMVGRNHFLDTMPETSHEEGNLSNSPYLVEGLAAVEIKDTESLLRVRGDRKGLYYNGDLVKDVDIDSVWVMPQFPDFDGNVRYLFKDKNHIYYDGQKIAGDVKTAFNLEDGYYLDAQHIYFRGKILEGALPNAFEKKSVFIISNGYVFYMFKRLPLDANTFEELTVITEDTTAIGGCMTLVYGGSILKDKNGTYRLHASGILELMPEGESNLGEEDDA